MQRSENRSLEDESERVAKLICLLVPNPAANNSNTE